MPQAKAGSDSRCSVLSFPPAHIIYSLDERSKDKATHPK